VWSGGDGAGATWKQARWRGDLVLPAMMAAVGALQREVGGGGAHGGGHACGGTSEWWGR
jgi:hypothetical protein